MKPHFPTQLILGLVALFLTSHAWAQADLVKQKAQQISNNNNQQQGVVTSAPAASVAPSAPSMPVPPPNPEQLKLVNRLATAFAAIKPGVPATEAQKNLLATNINGLSKSGVKPGKEALNKLSSDLAAALSDKPLSEHLLRLFSQQINVVMNSSSIKGTVAQSYVMNADKILKSANIKPSAVQAVTTDLTAIVTTLQKSKPKLYQ